MIFLVILYKCTNVFLEILFVSSWHLPKCTSSPLSHTHIHAYIHHACNIITFYIWWISYLMVVQYVYKRGGGGIVVLVHIYTLYNAHIIMTFSNDVFLEISPCINSCHVSICLYICICFCSPSLSLLLFVSLLLCVCACVFVFHDSIKLQNHTGIIYIHTHTFILFWRLVGDSFS